MPKYFIDVKKLCGGDAGWAKIFYVPDKMLWGGGGEYAKIFSALEKNVGQGLCQNIY